MRFSNTQDMAMFDLVQQELPFFGLREEINHLHFEERRRTMLRISEATPRAKCSVTYVGKGRVLRVVPDLDRLFKGALKREASRFY